MNVLAAALYAVTAISLPAGQTVDIASTSSFSNSRAPNSPPATFALSRRGSLAVLLRPDSIDGNGMARKVLIVRADGTRVTLGLPPDTVLANAFLHYEAGSRGEPVFPTARFSSIALAGDGTPFATVSLPFSGAYSGVDDAVFRWNGERWRDVLETIALPIDTRNVTIGAVASARVFAVNANYLNSFGNLDAVERDPHTQENQTLLINGATTVKLGYGAATAMRARFVTGYSHGDRLVVISGEPAHPSTALEWAEGRRISLGPGIAYGVNDRGDVVGNNDPNLTGAGSPTLWQSGRTIRLGDGPGSAYAIADDGTLIGAIHDSAFLVRGSDASHKIVRIDRLLGQSRWHVNAAYGIAADGRILATGRKAHGPLEILLLDPQNKAAVHDDSIDNSGRCRRMQTCTSTVVSRLPNIAPFELEEEAISKPPKVPTWSLRRRLTFNLTARSSKGSYRR